MHKENTCKYMDMLIHTYNVCIFMHVLHRLCIITFVCMYLCLYVWIYMALLTLSFLLSLHSPQVHLTKRLDSQVTESYLAQDLKPGEQGSSLAFWETAHNACFLIVSFCSQAACKQAPQWCSFLEWLLSAKGLQWTDFVLWGNFQICVHLFP